MRTVLLCLLVSGCGVLDGIADNTAYAPSNNRVFLGSDTVFVKHRAAMDRYTCGREHLVCESVGSSFFCSCETVTLVRASR